MLDFSEQDVILGSVMIEFSYRPLTVFFEAYKEGYTDEDKVLDHPRLIILEVIDMSGCEFEIDSLYVKRKGEFVLLSTVIADLAAIELGLEPQLPY